MPKSCPKIVFIHLLNDLSGSPKVLSQVIEIAKESQYDIDLYTSKTSGFLTQINGVNTYDIKYKLRKKKIFTLFALIYSQIRLIFLFKKYRKQNVIFYVNTLLPFGAGLAGKIYNKKVIYHIHETSISPQLWKTFLLFIVKKTASKIIYVSNFLKDEETIPSISKSVIYNSLSESFENINISRKNRTNTILMICSLKKYKGILQYVALAKEFPGYNFQLILNADEKEIESYFTQIIVPTNLKLIPKQINLHPYYAKADILINASLPNEWVETFGLTIIEAMAYGIPSIVPPVGGPIELVKNYSNGFCVDSSNLPLMKQKLNTLLDSKKYIEFSKNAYNESKKYNSERFKKEITFILSEMA